MAAEVWAQGGAVTLTSTLTTTLNNSAFDRFLWANLGPTAACTVTMDDGSKKILPAVAYEANLPRRVPLGFFPSGTNLRGGSAAGSDCDVRIDELRVNQ